MRILTICAAAVMLCGAMFAYAGADQMTVRLSSPVMVGGTELPAGDVHIQMLRGPSSTTLVFRSQSGVAATVIVNRIFEDPADAGARLVMKNAGGIRRLDRVMRGDHTGYQLLY